MLNQASTLTGPGAVNAIVVARLVTLIEACEGRQAHMAELQNPMAAGPQNDQRPTNLPLPT